jgi:class 3 adenylate cyclase
VPLARTQYVRSGDIDIAYQVLGEGPRDIVVVLDWASHLETLVEQPFFAEWFTSLARFGRVLWLNTRGAGMSGPLDEDAPIESWLSDLLAVIDAAGVDNATVVAHGLGAQMALMAAASHPERVDSLVIVNGYARFAQADDYPAGLPERMWGPYAEALERQWGARVERFGASPRVARAAFETVLTLDVRDVLPLVDVPTLVIHNRDNVFVRVGHGRYLAEHIPGARLVELDSADHWPIPEAELVETIEEFVTGSRSGAGETHGVLATVLFVDVVASTEFAAKVGDRTWAIALERLESAVRTVLVAFGGTLESTAGDGFLATFDGSARAIRCAWRIRNEARNGGLEVRCGLHSGEITRRPEGITGIAVHIGARVSSLAAPGEVLVTRTVRDHVVGSGIRVDERGEHELRGVPDRWALYAAVA